MICLKKDPEDRFQTAHDIKLELQWIAAERAASVRLGLPPSGLPRRERLGWAAAVVAAVILTAIAGVMAYRPVPLARFNTHSHQPAG